MTGEGHDGGWSSKRGWGSWPCLAQAGLSDGAPGMSSGMLASIYLVGVEARDEQRQQCWPHTMQARVRLRAAA